jgi:hypothetical protein
MKDELRGFWICKCIVKPKNVDYEFHYKVALQVMAKKMHLERSCAKWDSLLQLRILQFKHRFHYLFIWSCNAIAMQTNQQYFLVAKFTAINLSALKMGVSSNLNTLSSRYKSHFLVLNLFQQSDSLKFSMPTASRCFVLLTAGRL